MNLGFRILMAVYGFCLTIVSFVIMIITLKPDLFDAIALNISYELQSNRNFSFFMFIVGFIFFSMSLTFLLSGFKSGKDKKAIRKQTNIGLIKISHMALETIALNSVRKFGAVREAKAYVFNANIDSVSIVVKAVVMSEVNIPALSEDMQVKIKRSIEESAGVTVNDVKVIIENIYSTYKARVE